MNRRLNYNPGDQLVPNQGYVIGIKSLRQKQNLESIVSINSQKYCSPLSENRAETDVQQTTKFEQFSLNPHSQTSGDQGGFLKIEDGFEHVTKFTKEQFPESPQDKNDSDRQNKKED